MEQNPYIIKDAFCPQCIALPLCKLPTALCTLTFITGLQHYAVGLNSLALHVQLFTVNECNFALIHAFIPGALTIKPCVYVYYGYAWITRNSSVENHECAPLVYV